MAGDPKAYPPIGDYAIIGDCRSGALVSRQGSVDWLCLPRFDSPSIFGAILDARAGGCFAIAPDGPSDVTRRYLGDSAVLETTFTTASGVVRLTDLMPVADEEAKGRQLWPEHELLRKVECVDGQVTVEVVYDPRPDYGRAAPRLTEQGAVGLVCEHRGRALALRSDIRLGRTDGARGARGRVTLRRGERRYLSLFFGAGLPLVTRPLGEAAERQVESSREWWEAWSARSRYGGPYRQAVMRSAITLKLMTYAPSGAVIAALTTSLPEKIGGVRNWDYRFCWLRDASLTLRALLDLGYEVEGQSFLSWMLHATRLTWPELQILYDVYGESHLPETTLDHLEGYAGSSPVRVGNAAADQLQLDTYGEVIDAAFQYVERGGQLDRTTARMLTGLGKAVCRRWREPDEGIWEPRGPRKHHTHSKAMCWVALDRLVRMHEAGHLEAPVRTLAREREAVRSEVETHGYSERLQSYVSVYDGDEVDASLLLLGVNGYVDPASPRMRSTCLRVHERLGKNGLLYRYRGDDGLPAGEGAFGICSFWGVECRALQGDRQGAAAAFERVLSYANDLGLFAEEIEPETGAALGNFPQAFTHVGLISAALTLGAADAAPRPAPSPGGSNRV